MKKYKNIQNLLPLKKRLRSFLFLRHPLKMITPKKWFFTVFPENIGFSEKNIKQKNIRTLFVIKKIIFIFGVEHPPPLKNGHGLRKRFFRIFCRNITFFEKIA